VCQLPKQSQGHEEIQMTYSIPFNVSISIDQRDSFQSHVDDLFDEVRLSASRMLSLEFSDERELRHLLDIGSDDDIPTGLKYL
jgi:hypothetical protein